MDVGLSLNSLAVDAAIRTSTRLLTASPIRCLRRRSEEPNETASSFVTSTPAAELALDEVRRSFGYIVGKRAAIPDGSSVLVELHGPIEARFGAVVDRRARFLDDLDHADTTVRTDSLTFMLLACGRIDPETHLANGDVELRGNKDLAGQLARNLRFTM